MAIQTAAPAGGGPRPIAPYPKFNAAPAIRSLPESGSSSAASATTMRLNQSKIMPTSDEAQTMPDLSELQKYSHAKHGDMLAMMEKQFYMLKYDATVSMRTAISECVKDLAEGYADSQLDYLLKDRGGTYDARGWDGDSSSAPIISDIRFTRFSLERGLGMAFHITASAPPGPARSFQYRTRKEFWEVGKRLWAGGMVAIVTHRLGTRPDVRMAVVATDVVPSDIKTIAFSISFPNPIDEQWAIGEALRPDSGCPPLRFIVENPDIFAFVRPFLLGLQTSAPTLLESSLLRAINFPLTSASASLRPPAYSLRPGFKWNLSSLLKPDAEPKQLSMAPTKDGSVGARNALHSASFLDPSQTDAILSTLSTELALVQGPPGTGKTFIGVQLLKLFILNKVGPIIIMAQTNHALDNILRALYDTKVTEDILRLGNRTEDPVLMGLTMESRMPKGVRPGRAIRNRMKQLEMDMAGLSARLMRKASSAELFQQALASRFPIHLQYLLQPPAHIQAMLDDATLEAEDAWAVAPRSGARGPRITPWSFWADGGDIAHLQGPQKLRDARRKDSAEELEDRLAQMAIDETAAEAVSLEREAELFEGDDWDSAKPPQSQTHDAGLVTTPTQKKHQLFADPNLWTYSLGERRSFQQMLSEQVKVQLHPTDQTRLKALTEEHAALSVELTAARTQARAQALEGIKVVGCTTHGAANMREVIQAISPKIMLVEEAGQALEAHILAALSPSIEHLIQIGDPEQLRCITTCHGLSVESGATDFRLNESMMERLSGAGHPMMQLSVQRRMRPQISSLIRAPIYPNLQDHAVVSEYPAVRGATKNVFFLDHRHWETPDGQGKANPWEASIAAELALYFAKQGCYPEEKGVVILCAYASQLIQVKKCLVGRARITTGEKEQEALARFADWDDEYDDSAGDGTTVMVRTIDSFQGEEADIIILSLVRNAGNDFRASIGFLKTTNRINVAISRARHGLFIFGNALQLASRSDFWNSAITELDEADCVGDELPLGCSVHGLEQRVRDPADFQRLAPNGGCVMVCGVQMSCGHDCGRQCHPTDPEHSGKQCKEPCLRELACGHACAKACRLPCGPCEVVVGGHVLRCGHEVEVKCCEQDRVDELKCSALVPVSGGSCEHISELPCGSTGSLLLCSQACGLVCGDCGQACSASCSACQSLNALQPDAASSIESGLATPPPEHVTRKIHADHRCGRSRQCGHDCESLCRPDHHHSRAAGEKSTSLHRCDGKGAARDCVRLDLVDGMLCNESSGQSCSHRIVPCYLAGSVSLCNSPCAEHLRCGHPCPSICSEPCQYQECLICSDGTGFEVLSRDGAVLFDYTDQSTVTHDCGATIAIGDISTDPIALVDRSDTCPSCSRPLYSDPPELAGPDPTPHFEKHVIRDLTRLMDSIESLAPDLGVYTINSLIVPSLAKVDLPSPTRLPSSQQLDRLVSLGDPDMGKALPVFSSAFDQGLDELFAIPPPLRQAWLKLVQPILDRYAKLDTFHSPPIDTPKTSHFRLQAILQSIGCRLVLALYARQFALAIREKGSQLADASPAHFASRLFTVLLRTLLRSCDRDVRLAHYLAGRPGMPTIGKLAVASCQIAISQSTFLLTHYHPPTSDDEAEDFDDVIYNAQEDARAVLHSVMQDLEDDALEETDQLDAAEVVLAFWGKIGEGVEMGEEGEAAHTRLLKDLTEGCVRLANGKS